MLLSVLVELPNTYPKKQIL